MQVRERSSVAPERRDDERSVFQSIVQNALAATGARMVHMTRLNPEMRSLRVVAWAALPGGTVQRALLTLRKRYPDLDLSELIIRADVNSCNEQTYLYGQSVFAPFIEMTHGMVDDRVLELVSARTGIRYVFTCPILLGGQVTGALAYHLARPITEAQQRACEAFAREAALTLENAHLSETLRQQVDELQRSRRLITAAEERQRREIAELLHGRVQTSLLVAWHRLGQCEAQIASDPEGARTLIGEVREQLDHIREQEVRQASHLLHPSIIRVGLAPAVRSLAARFEGSFRVEISVDDELTQIDDPAENRIPEDLRLVAYRILEEALNNIYRHAGASLVHIGLSATADQCIRVCVRDDGRGFNPARLRPGLGLSSIADRVSQVSGKWDLTSAVGLGTTLSATLPLLQPLPQPLP